MAHKHPVRSKTSNLVSTLLENPQLPAYIQRLEGNSLAKLVQHLGKEDAQPILQYATPEQITDLIEIDAWQSPSPGAEETFSPEKFLEWIELWSDAGPTQLCTQLRNLGAQLFALTLDKYVVVVDIFKIGVSGFVDTFDRFGVMPKDDEQWPLLFQFLCEIWEEDPAFLDEAFGYCCQCRSLVVEKTYSVANENLAPDVEGDRDRHRRERGYVTTLSASAFLSRLKACSLTELLLESTYDPATAMQLKRNNNLHASGQPATAHSAFSSSAQNEIERHHRALADLLDPILTELNPGNKLLLEGPDQPQPTYLEQQLQALGQRDSAALEHRFREVVFLGNVVMEGTSLNGKRLTEKQATDCVYHSCNLGLEYCVNVEPWDEESALVRELLEQEPGLIRCFNIGYFLLQAIPRKLHGALKRALESAQFQRRLRKEPWLQTLIREEFATAQQETDPNGRFHNLNPLLDSLLFLCDATALEQLRLLADSLPRFPTSLAAQGAAPIHVSKEWRFFATPGDLQAAHTFLAVLESRLW
jgi:hypothetical protein